MPVIVRPPSSPWLRIARTLRPGRETQAANLGRKTPSDHTRPFRRLRVAGQARFETGDDLGNGPLPGVPRVGLCGDSQPLPGQKGYSTPEVGAVDVDASAVVHVQEAITPILVPLMDGPVLSRRVLTHSRRGRRRRLCGIGQLAENLRHAPFSCIPRIWPCCDPEPLAHPEAPVAWDASEETSVDVDPPLVVHGQKAVTAIFVPLHHSSVLPSDPRLNSKLCVISGRHVLLALHAVALQSHVVGLQGLELALDIVHHPLARVATVRLEDNSEPLPDGQAQGASKCASMDVSTLGVVHLQEAIPARVAPFGHSAVLPHDAPAYVLGCELAWSLVVVHDLCVDNLTLHQVLATAVDAVHVGTAPVCELDEAEAALVPLRDSALQPRWRCGVTIHRRRGHCRGRRGQWWARLHGRLHRRVLRSWSRRSSRQGRN
mmetsp:Transcript_112253/g.317275  ORF Transcript_112253/g.317275 Transcript_112253/m.317275 type:complete len:431 (-) Transcript_112253:90-1382(-)